MPRKPSLNKVYEQSCSGDNSLARSCIKRLPWPKTWGSPSKSREPKTLTFFVTFLENFGSVINVGAFNSESLLFTVKDNKFSVGSVAGRIYPA